MPAAQALLTHPCRRLWLRSGGGSLMTASVGPGDSMLLLLRRLLRPRLLLLL